MSDIILFQFENNEVRYVGDGITHEWIAKDVCEVLGIANTSQALKNFTKKQKGICDSDTLGGSQAMLTVTEPGLFKLIFKSTKENAERFQDWVTDEVLPSIRKTGSYSIESLEQQFKPKKGLTFKQGRDYKELLELMGVDPSVASSIVLDEVSARYELPVADAVKALPSAKQTQKGMNGGELGEALGMTGKPRTNASRLNKLMESLGWLISVKKADGKHKHWEPTGLIEKDVDYILPVADKANGSKTTQLLWLQPMIAKLQEYVVDGEVAA